MVQYTETGMNNLVRILGQENAANAIKHFEKLSPDFSHCLVEQVYGLLATRSRVDAKTRELAVVSNIMGQGSSAFALRTHLKSMLNVGWSKEEVIEVIIELTAYNGFPRCIETLELFNQVCEELKL